jgi:hypothetical protein
MPEIKSTFIKSKMNKDLDARILPEGEYRDAQNIAVSKSDGPDVGALENILGNISLTDFGLTDNNLKIIGHYEDMTSNRIFVFLTNYNDSSVDNLSNFALGGATDTSLPGSPTFGGSKCYICCYNILTGISNILVSGNFLNFSKTSPILGVDLIENLLFWTDNRNQPRKINIQKAIDDSTYYTTEDQISVSKYYPWEAITFLDNGNNSTLKNRSSEFLPYHTLSTISSIGGGPTYAITLTAPNSNISIGDKAYSPDVPEGGYAIVSGVGAMPPNTVTLVSSSGGILDPDTIGWNIGRLKTGNGQLTSSISSNTTGATNGTHSINLPNGGAGAVDGVTVTGSGEGGEITVHVSGGVVVKVDVNIAGKNYANGNTITFDATAVTWMDPASTDIIITLASVNDDFEANPSIYFAKPNPDYISTFPGDPEFLKDKFPRFSYRFKFDDGEYSLMAPFSQIGFIPDQGGCFMLGDESNTKTSGVVKFMENWVDTVGLNISLPSINTSFNELYKVDEIEILYKDSSSQGVYVVDSIKTDPESGFDRGGVTGVAITTAGTGYTNGIYTNIPTTGGTGVGLTFDLTIAGNAVTAVSVNSIGSGYTNGDLVSITLSTAGTVAILALTIGSFSNYIYWYESQKPYQVLPEKDLIRVHDKVPVRAAAQASSGNRIIYGNFYNKHTSPDYLNYELKLGEKNTIISGSNIKKELPNHTLKQNRSYQVGVVLVDRFGRSSNVILRQTLDNVNENYNNSTIFAPYTNAGASPYEWFGNSLKINFLDQIPATDSTPGYPGLYSTSNPLGWYSYKIVIKQQEQEYYNVYLPGALSGNIDWSGAKTSELTYSNGTFVSNIALFGENINKVPKETINVGPTDEIFGSKVQLYNRVMQVGPAATTSANSQSPPNGSAHDVTAIQQFRDLGSWTLEKVNLTTSPFCYPQSDPFFNVDDNPYIASLSTPFRVGYPTTDQINPYWNFAKNLIVYETNAVKSNLDIYWETTTTGLINQLNSSIYTSAGNDTPDKLSDFSIIFDESSAPNTDIVNTAFEALDTGGNQMGDQTATMVLDKIVNGNGVTVQTGNSGVFDLYQFSAAAPSVSPTWKIRTGVGQYFSFQQDSDVVNSYTFYVTATGNGGSKTFRFFGSLSNATPIIHSGVTHAGVTVVSGDSITVSSAIAAGPSTNDYILKFTDFINGTNAANPIIQNKVNGCTFFVDSVTNVAGSIVTPSFFKILNGTWPATSLTGPFLPILKASSANVQGTWIVKIKLTDCWQIFGSNQGSYSNPPALQGEFDVTIEIT